MFSKDKSILNHLQIRQLPLKVSQTLGHSSVQTTLDHYNKLIKNRHKVKRAAFLDEIF